MQLNSLFVSRHNFPARTLDHNHKSDTVLQRLSQKRLYSKRTPNTLPAYWPTSVHFANNLTEQKVGAVSIMGHYDTFPQQLWMKASLPNVSKWSGEVSQAARLQPSPIGQERRQQGLRRFIIWPPRPADCLSIRAPPNETTKQLVCVWALQPPRQVFCIPLTCTTSGSQDPNSFWQHAS